MARGVNGYVTINVGVANGHTKVSAGSGLNEDERHRRARRLRKEGWSYRRIAATLEMSYASVCHLLDGEEARLPPSATPALPPRRVVRPSPAAPAPLFTTDGDPLPIPANSAGGNTTSARIEELSAQIMVLQQRLDTVLAMNEAHRQSLARLERSMVTTLQNEHRALGQRLHAAVKSLLERMIPISLRAWAAASERTPDDQG